MARTVFWSWQSDLSPRETRNLIKDALSSAIDKLSASLEEADRPEIDHDTKGVPGTPEIAATILSKIDKTSIFVADVTPIVVSPSGKHVANPNVLIELGYAKKAITPSRMVLVWNTAIHESKPEDLPFDLRHRRGPISFSLAIGAEKAELRKVRAELEDALHGALADILAALPPEAPVALPWHESAAERPAIWRDNSVGLPVNHGGEQPAEVAVDTGPLGFARLLPTKWQMREDALRILNHPTQNPIPLGRFGGLNWGPTTAGFLVYRHNDSVEESGVTTTATRWFRATGELWGVDARFIREEGDHPTYSELYTAERWLAWLKQSVLVCNLTGGEPPFHIRLGIDELRGVRWAPAHFDFSVPQALEESVLYEADVLSDDANELREHVRRALNAVRDSFGLAPLSDANFQSLAQRTLT